MDDVRTELDEAIALVDSPAARIRLAGLLRLVRLADAEPRLRQGVVTVLGAYLRRPLAVGDPTAADRETRSELDTRRAVLAAVRTHLQDPDDPASWCGLDVDLRDTLLAGDLSGVVVTAGAVRLDRAHVPAGATLDLSGARVSGGVLSLDRLDVVGRLDLTGLVVEDGEVSVDKLLLGPDGEVVADDARVSGGTVLLREADVGEGSLSLRRLYAAGGTVSLHQTHVAGGEVRLDGVRVDGGTVHLSAATVDGGALRLDGADVAQGLLSLALTCVHAGTLSLDGARAGEGGTVGLEGVTVDDDAHVVWGPFQPVRAGTPDDAPDAVVRDLDLRGPAPADRWAWLDDELAEEAALQRRAEMTTPDAPGRQDVPSPPERAAS